jgi:hypothetical protein
MISETLYTVAASSQSNLHHYIPFVTGEKQKIIE